MADLADLAVFDLSRFPVHLGLGARVIRQPQFTGGMDWYNGYGERNGADGLEGRLVTIHSFAAPWDTWEMHPKGDELVVCLAGRITLHQEHPERRQGAHRHPGTPPGDREPARRLAHRRRQRAGHRPVHHRRDGDGDPAALSRKQPPVRRRASACGSGPSRLRPAGRGWCAPRSPAGWRRAASAASARASAARRRPSRPRRRSGTRRAGRT